MNDIKSLKESLKIIEGLCYLFDDGDMSLKSAEGIMSDIYKVAHVHGSCENPHLDWREDRIKLKKELGKAGLI